MSTPQTISRILGKAHARAKRQSSVIRGITHWRGGFRVLLVDDLVHVYYEPQSWATEAMRREQLEGYAATLAAAGYQSEIKDRPNLFLIVTGQHTISTPVVAIVAEAHQTGDRDALLQRYHEYADQVAAGMVESATDRASAGSDQPE